MEKPLVTAVLLMAYGGPDRIEDVEPYILDVRSHRPTSPELIAEMRHRYERIGGGSPILERTRAQATALESALADTGRTSRVYVGMRHWHPYIRDVLGMMQADGVRRAIGLVMAPHYSRMSIGAYENAVREAEAPIDVRVIASWHTMPEYIETVLERIASALARFPADEQPGVHLLMTAHSLPERIVAEGDPYADQLRDTFDLLRSRLGRRPCWFAYQSAAMTPEPWLGPDAGDVIEQLAAAGASGVLIVPIGFTSDHVEILYDIDIEYRDLADGLGIGLERIDMMNDHPLMMRGLARLVADEIQHAGWR